MSPSSRGLGHHPFTVSTGVRIPVGTPEQVGKLAVAITITPPDASLRGVFSFWLLTWADKRGQRLVTVCFLLITETGTFSRF